ncbi:MarR family transcriptional regulator [Chromobacterium subtsugae]|uniref:MarR family transcriptional regulator n=1 Tax=Chromobacterium subtsugae TaxID=251747 RepID=A0ABS7FFB6_9NEIS|nr:MULTISPECIES: MarR family transcriptional regulator [Chromobacterium]KUM05544.1 MarR family transcriptional regulator [Chromobacterium subtsugae]KZE85421.1 MarR family transcriptional regulator [Chromobacterium sp. F49]MBW7567619.1 MarR family transcriptional regulator [Chromobacterium subtsugae]MBW8288753.1 MarR family transcriptional regulator [Chromobacterium subtsugae]OBU87103.1 MarR family transcriptional regulator [Chromobacterium subtsugae]
MSPNKSFAQLEQAINHVEARFPGVPRQEVILTRLIFHIVPRLSAHMCESLKQHGLNETVWMALLALYACPNQALNPSDISETLDSSRTNATRIADELVKNGWAARSASSEDRRKIVLELTAAGVALVESLLPYSREVHKTLWADFDSEEKALLERLMRKLLSKLGG